MKTKVAVFVLLVASLCGEIQAKGEAEWEREQNYNKMKTEWEDLNALYPASHPCKPDYSRARLVYKGGKWIVVKAFKLLAPVTVWLDAVVSRQSAWLCFKGTCLKGSGTPSVEQMRSYVLAGLGTCGDYLNREFAYSCQKWEDASLGTINRCNNPCSNPTPIGIYNEIKQACEGGGF
jgi:hypothetical protein